MSKDYGSIKINDHDHYIEDVAIHGYPHCLCIKDYRKDPKPVVAYVLMTEEYVLPPDATEELIEKWHKRPELASLQCWVWHIYVDDKCRKQGYATALLKELQKRYLRIQSQIASKAGRDAFLKNGFRMVSALHRKDEDELVWEKGKDEKASK